MRTILGIDLGTSSVKAMLFDAEQGVIAVRAEEYGVDIAHPGWAQQSPALWWESLVRVLRWLESHYREAYRSVCAVGYSGQMHGMVLTWRITATMWRAPGCRSCPMRPPR